MQLSGELIRLFTIETIILFIAFAVAFLFTKKRAATKELPYWVIYMIITFSSYNIYIKPIQDFLIPIPRTYIFFKKIIGSLTLYDIFISVVFIKVIWKMLKYRGERALFYSNNSLSLILKREIILTLISYLGLIFFVLANQPVDFTSQLRTFRGIMSGIVFVYFTFKVLDNYKNPRDCIRFITIIMVIDFSNIMSQFISTFFLGDILWQRGGHNVVLYDQTEGQLFFSYLPFILIKNRIIPKYIKWMAIIVVCLNIYNVPKTIYLYSGLAVVISVLVGLIKGKMPRRLAAIGMFSLVIIAIFFVSFAMGSSNSKLSRLGQANSLFSVFEKNPVNFFFGIGDGGLFPRQTMSEDAGEIRAIDIESIENSGLQGSVQTRYLSFMKTSGLIGLVYALVIFFRLLMRSFKLIKLNWLIFFFYVCWILYISGIMVLFRADPQCAIFTCTQYIVFVMLYKIYTYNEASSAKNLFRSKDNSL